MACLCYLDLNLISLIRKSVIFFIVLFIAFPYTASQYFSNNVPGGCVIPETLRGEWFSRENGDNLYTIIDDKRMHFRNYLSLRYSAIRDCIDLYNKNNDNFTIIFQESANACYHCVRLFIRTINILEKIETGCVNLNSGQEPTISSVCRSLDPNQQLITLFATKATPKNCRSSLEGIWQFAYQNRYKFTGECKHHEANITACQNPGSQFFILNQQFTMYYKQCEGMMGTENAEVQYKCLGDWFIGKNHFFAVANTRESRPDEKYRCFLANRDDDSYLALSDKAECSSLKTPQEGPERLRLTPVKAEVVPPRCSFPDNFTGDWLNTANFDADVVINKTHIIEIWKPDQGRERDQIYVCQERRHTRIVLARMGINGCQKDFVCIEFVPRHHNIIRYRKGRAMMTSKFATVCAWTAFPDREEWKYDLLIAKNPSFVKCPVAGKFSFQQTGDILFETRIRGGVTKIPRPNVYCRENISDFSVCDKEGKIITIDADYCISVDYSGRPDDIYSEPDYQMHCVGFWKENMKSYLITYDTEDAYSRYRCWVYQRADLNRIVMSLSVGAFCHLKQDVFSSNASEGAQVALQMVEYEREHDNCPMYFDDGSNPYLKSVDQATVLKDAGVFTLSCPPEHIIAIISLYFLLRTFL